MIAYAKALEILLQAARSRPPLPAETVNLPAANGRVAARRLLSAEPLPPFDNSAMDGYAVKAAETSGAPLWFAVKGTIAAGDAPLTGLATGAYEIMTGAPIPPGYDAVVPLEHVNLMDRGRSVEVLEPANPGDYVRARGRDFPAGAPVVEAGTRLEPRHLLALAALGVDTLEVRQRPTVAILSTGKELVDPGRKPGPGQIRNSTATYLIAALSQAGVVVRYLGTVGDDPETFKSLVKTALKTSPDLILTTGAVSKGRWDFVAPAVADLGAETLYHNVSIRPGKPGLAARFKDGTLLFGMPGNPLSTVVGLRFFVMPVLRALLGMPEERPALLALASDVAKPVGLRCFFKARTLGGTVSALTGQASFQIQPLLQADAWVVLPEEGDLAAAGAQVEVYPL